MKLKTIATAAFAALLILGATGCKDSKSYAELLKDEEHAVNWYMAQHEIITEIPKDSISFITGPNAPYYKMDSEGNIYMRVIEKGDMSKRAKEGDRVYFTFMHQSIKALFDGQNAEWAGNEENLNTVQGSTSFVFGNQVLTSSSKWGTGIQLPLKFFGYYCQVEMVIKSREAFTDYTTSCDPYVYKVRYFPALY